MNVKNFLNIIPKPSNSDVIIYNTELQGLLNINVFSSYEEHYKLFNENSKDINELQISLNKYKQMIDSAYLYNKSWNESDYINMLQKDKKTYATIYNNIKKIEDKINVLQKKIDSLDEAIEMQKIKDNKDIEKKKANLDIEIEKKKESLSYLKEKTTLHKAELLYINKNIEDLAIEKTNINDSLNNTQNDNYCCELCGTKLDKKRPINRIVKFYENKLNNINEMLNIYQQRKKELEDMIKNLVSQQKETQISLNNDLQFKQQDYNIYQKKSIDVLKLEALRNKTIKDISQQENLLKIQPDANSDDFKELKDRINKFELSLSNLKKIKILKQEYQEKINKLTKLQQENKTLENNIIKELNFISIYYKICEQKINNYIGENITIKLFKIENYELIENLQIFYNETKYEDLDEDTREKIDKIIAKYIYKDL